MTCCSIYTREGTVQAAFPLSRIKVDTRLLLKPFSQLWLELFLYILDKINKNDDDYENDAFIILKKEKSMQNNGLGLIVLFWNVTYLKHMG